MGADCQNVVYAVIRSNLAYAPEVRMWETTGPLRCTIVVPELCKIRVAAQKAPCLAHRHGLTTVQVQTEGFASIVQMSLPELSASASNKWCGTGIRQDFLHFYVNAC